MNVEDLKQKKKKKGKWKILRLLPINNKRNKGKRVQKFFLSMESKTPIFDNLQLLEITIIS